MDEATLQQTSRRHSRGPNCTRALKNNNSAIILHRLWLDIHVGNVLHVIFRYCIDTQAGVVRVERLLLHKGDVNNVLPTAIAYRSVPRYGYCVSCSVPCSVYCETPVHLCIVPALNYT